MEAIVILAASGCLGFIKKLLVCGARTVQNGVVRDRPQNHLSGHTIINLIKHFLNHAAACFRDQHLHGSTSGEATLRSP